MRLWPHSHRWTVVGAKFNPPRTPEAMVSARGTSDELMPVLFGITNLAQRCRICGLTKIETVVGRSMGVQAW